MSEDKTLNEKKIRINITLSSEAYGLIKAESERANLSISEILERLILESCLDDEDLPYESHSYELEEAKKRLDAYIGKIDLV